MTDARSYLSLLAATRTWETGSWQRTFLDASDLDRLATIVHDLLDGNVLSRGDFEGDML